jgi:hypothetical protein
MVSQHPIITHFKPHTFESLKNTMLNITYTFYSKLQPNTPIEIKISPIYSISRLAFYRLILSKPNIKYIPKNWDFLYIKNIHHNVYSNGLLIQSKSIDSWE